MRERVTDHYRKTKGGKRKKINSYTRDIARTSSAKKVPSRKVDDESIQAQRELIFSMVRNKENWKLPTKPFRAETESQRDMIMDAITHFTGGAETKKNPDGSFRITSKGYYHYIGA